MAVKMIMPPPESSNTLLQFLQRIHPRSCLSSACLKSMPFEEDEEEMYSIQRLPYLIKAISVTDLAMMDDDQLHLSETAAERRFKALETLYAFTGKKDLRLVLILFRPELHETVLTNLFCTSLMLNNLFWKVCQ